MKSRATLTSKGQTTIPKEVRDYLHLVPGDQVDFVIEAEGRVTLRAETLDVSSLKGLLQDRKRKTVSLDEMENAIADGAAGKKP